MKRIFKYIVNFNSKIPLVLPKGAEILTVQNQHGRPCLWVLVDPEAETEIRSFRVFGTGEFIHYDMGVEYKYIATVQDGQFIWHFFEQLSS